MAKKPYKIVCIARRKEKSGVPNNNPLEVKTGVYSSQKKLKKHLSENGYSVLIFLSPKMIDILGESVTIHDLKLKLETRIECAKGDAGKTHNEITQFIWDNFTELLDLVID